MFQSEDYNLAIFFPLKILIEQALMQKFETLEKHNFPQRITFNNNKDYINLHNFVGEYNQL